MKITKTNAMRQLERMKVPYTAHEYESDGTALDGVTVATKIGKDPSMVFKTLVTTGSDGQLFVFCIPVALELDLKKAAKAAEQKSLSMLPVSRINECTGYVRGGCSPVGMKKMYPTYLSELASEQTTILVSGGKIGLQIEIEPEQLLKAVNAKMADCTHPAI